MTTLTVDDRKRVRIPGAKPGQVFYLHPKPDGSVLLVPVKEPDSKEAFPPGSLTRYLTKERDELQSALLRGGVQEPE